MGHGWLQWVLHDWSDEQCIKLLTNCFESLPQHGKVIIVESILPVDPENSVSANISFEEDLLMMAVLPGKERTQREYESLALKSGFSACKLICCAYNSWVMEFHKTAQSLLSRGLPYWSFFLFVCFSFLSLSLSLQTIPLLMLWFEQDLILISCFLR